MNYDKKRLREAASEITTTFMSDDLMVTVVADKVDTSFDHAFGTHYQFHYELSKVLINDVDIPLDYFDSKLLDKWEQKVYENSDY